MEAIRRYFSLIRHRRGFIIALGLLLAIALLSEIAGHTGLVLAEQSSARDLAVGLGDALIIAVVLALLVDPAAQHQFASEWGRDLYWAIFSPNAPPEFRNTLQALAAPRGYISKCTYEVEFNESKDSSESLDVFLRVRLRGVALDRRGFDVDQPTFVLSRHDGRPARYVTWSLERDNAEEVTYDGDELESMGAIRQDASGRTVLVQDALPCNRHIPFMEKYWSERRVETSRRAVDSFPLLQGQIVLRQQIVLRGTRLAELNFTVSQLGGEQLELDEHRRENGQTELRGELTHVGFPGQVTLISWRPRSLGVGDTAVKSSA